MSIIYRITSAFGYQWDDLQMAAWEHFLDLIMHYEGTDEDYLTLPKWYRSLFHANSLKALEDEAKQDDAAKAY